MNIVFVFGAGASHGEQLVPLFDVPMRQPSNRAAPPLTTGFFSKALYDSIGYAAEQAERDFIATFEQIRGSFGMSEPVGEGRWADLNIEEVFTNAELLREFLGRDGDAWAKATVARNELAHYISRIISYCTQLKRGLYYGKVKSFMDKHADVSVLNFNWDLILDQEFIERIGLGWGMSAGPYKNFETIVLGREAELTGGVGRWPLYLKLHGSLNWLQCANQACPSASGMTVFADTQLCLAHAMAFPGSGTVICNQCGAEMNVLLVPPILKKPVIEKGVIRAVWGQARHRLQMADKIVIVGFSAAPTDFYASWLLRSTIGTKPAHAAEILVVNPQNSTEHPGNEDFRMRMASIFPRGYNSEYQTFSQIDSILERVGRGR
jgi:hypothetical protein